MGRLKKVVSTHVEPEDEVQESPDEEPETDEAEQEDEKPESVPAASMSKASVCRAALAEGIETTEEAVRFAMTRYGMEIKPTDFTLYKSKEKAKQGVSSEPAKRGRKPKAASTSPEPSRAPAHAPAKVEGYLAPPPKPMSNGSELLDALEAMKPLVASLGKEQAHRLIELLG